MEGDNVTANRIRHPIYRGTSLGTAYEAAHQVQTAFGSLIEASQRSDVSAGLDKAAAELISDEYGRFRVWSGNIGALRSSASRSSLDSRLKSAPQMRESVLRNLELLSATLERSKCAFCGSSCNLLWWMFCWFIAT